MAKVTIKTVDYTGEIHLLFPNDGKLEFSQGDIPCEFTGSTQSNDSVNVDVSGTINSNLPDVSVLPSTGASEASNDGLPSTNTIEFETLSNNAVSMNKPTGKVRIETINGFSKTGEIEELISGLRDKGILVTIQDNQVVFENRNEESIVIDIQINGSETKSMTLKPVTNAR